MDTFISKGADDTFALGERWGQQAIPGWIIALSGDLGSGKTQLVKGIANGLGSVDPVRSPTFALLHEYHGGRLPLFHIDLYRLADPESIRRAGLEDYLFQDNGVTAVEWAEHWWETGPNPLAKPARRVWIEVLSENDRRISYEDLGA